MKEEWRDIKGFEGKYQVSNLGNVKSLNYNKTGEPKLLTGSFDKDGYHQVILSKNSQKNHFKTHRLVAQEFIPNPDNLPMVNHKNEQKNDNRVENLEWCDAKYNINYGSRKQKVSKALSKPVMCVETGQVYKNALVAAAELGLDNSSIGKCCKGIYKTCGKFHWQYIET